MAPDKQHCDSRQSDGCRIKAASTEQTGYVPVVPCNRRARGIAGGPSDDDKSIATGPRTGSAGSARFEIAPVHPIEVKTMKDHPASRALREANRAFKPVEPKKPMTDYAKAQQSLHENRERLKAERLAREAAQRSHPR